MRTRRALIAAAAAVVALGALGAPADAAKKKGKANSFSTTRTVGTAIPDGPPANTVGSALSSAISVPKKFKGKVVGDVNVTGITTLGSGPGAGAQLRAVLVAPDGTTVQLFAGLAATSIGPLTLDDDTDVSICTANPPAACPNPAQSLYRPYAGTANGTFGINGAFATNNPLTQLNGVPMRGSWTLRVSDTAQAPAATSILSGWGLKITAAKPVK